jgi:DNA-binding transcriptional ArsR family regulator
MANNGDALDAAYHALSDATRRAVVERLVAGPATITELAAPHPITLPTFLKHLRVLEDSGLVWSEKRGRVRTAYLERKTLRTAEAWFARQRRTMERKLDRLAAVAEQLEKESKK